MDRNGIKEKLPSGLSYRNLKPWQLDSICLREFYKGAGAYKPTLKELAFIYKIEENLLDRYEENSLIKTSKYEDIVNNSVEEIKLLINIHRCMNFKEVLTSFEVDVSEVKDITLEEPKSILHELYESKEFNAEAMKKHLKSKKMLKKEQETVKKLILAAYLDKVEILSFNKKETEEINNKRREEVEQFFKDLK